MLWIYENVFEKAWLRRRDICEPATEHVRAGLEAVNPILHSYRHILVAGLVLLFSLEKLVELDA